MRLDVVVRARCQKLNPGAFTRRGPEMKQRQTCPCPDGMQPRGLLVKAVLCYVMDFEPYELWANITYFLHKLGCFRDCTAVKESNQNTWLKSSYYFIRILWVKAYKKYTKLKCTAEQNIINHQAWALWSPSLLSPVNDQLCFPSWR